MKQKLKAALSFIFHMPLGVAIVLVFMIACGWYMFKDVYGEFKFHLSDAAFNILFWIIAITAIIIISYFANRHKKK